MKLMIKILSSTIIMSVFIISCGLFESPSLPSWDTHFRIHFRQDEITFNDLIKNDVIEDGYSPLYQDTLFFVNKKDITEKEGVNESDLRILPDDDTTIEEIGSIELNPEPKTTPEITFQDMFPGLLIAEGEIIQPIPEQLINPAPNTVQFGSEFEYITIESATMFLIFNNNLIMDIDSGMVITLVDSISTNELGTFNFNQPIPSGTSLRSSDVPVTGTLSSTYILSYSIPILGTSEADTLTQDEAQSNVTTEVNFINPVLVSEASAQVPEQKVNREGASFLDTENKVIRALVKTGMMRLEFHNNLPVDANVEIQLISLLDENGNPKVINRRVNANTDNPTLVNVPIDGYTIINHENPGVSFVDSMHYVMEANTISTGDSLVSIISTDNIEVDVTFPDSIVTSYFEGIITNTKIDIKPIEQTDIINLDRFEGEFRLPELVLNFDFHNEMGFPINLDLTITGKKEGKTVVIHLDDQIINADTTTIISLHENSTTPDIVDLMEILPSSILVEGTGVIENQQGSVFDSDSIWAEISIESLMRLQITDTLKYTGDIEELNLDNEIRENLANSENVILELNPDNGLPLNVDYIFIMALDTTELLNEAISDSTKKIVFRNLIEAGTLDERGLVSESKSVTFRKKLSKPQLKLFTRMSNDSTYAPIYSVIKSLVDSKDKTVIFRKNDTLIFNGVFEMDYEVNANGK